ncbi:vascular cell adhesion protein 1-like [Tautogolabrus adspersus]
MVVKGEDTWGVTHSSAQIYAPKRPSVSVSPSAEIVEGSSVTLTCSSDANPAATFKWYKRNQTPQYLPEGAQLVLSYIRPSNSGEYYCEAENKLGRTRSQRVSINVKYAPTVCSATVRPAGEIRENSRVTVTCSCDGFPPPEYTWYNKYGRKLSKTSELVFSSVQSSDSGRYYCTAKNDLGGRRSGYADVEVKYAPKLLSVSVSPSAEIVEGSSVTLTCSSDANPAAKYTWYKKNQKLPKGQELQGGQRYDFPSIRSEDRGIYFCQAENKHGQIKSVQQVVDVQYAPKLPSVSVSPSAEIVEGSSVTLTCSSDANPAAKYTWFKKNNNQPLSIEAQLVFSSIKSSDSGEFYCKAENKLGEKTSTWISVDVKYAPKLPSVSVSPSAEIVEGSSVTLTCSSDANPAAKYTWFKENGPLNLHPSNAGAQLVFSTVNSSASGEYYCVAENELGRTTSKHISINVKSLQVQVKRIQAGQNYIEAELTCHSSCSEAGRLSYVWFKNRQIITRAVTSTYKDWFSLEDEISCALNGHDGFPSPSVYAPKLPSVSVSPPAEIVENRTLTLNCSTDANPAANCTWYKKNGNQDIKPFSKGAELVFSSVQSSDSGEFYCAAENELGRRTSEHVNVDVKYAPKLPSVSVTPSGKIMEGSSVTLSCSSDANPAATYTWNKKNQTAPQGRQGLYRFTSISPEDRGMFYCTSENQYGRINSSTLFVDVQCKRKSQHFMFFILFRQNFFDAPKLPSVSVSPIGEIVEGSPMTLTCSSDANPAAKYTWFKENQTLLQGQDYSFTSISSMDSGIYICRSENKYGQRNSTGLHVNVEYAPKLPSVSASPSVEIMEGSSVTLTCSSDANPVATYTWYKKDELASIASGQIFTIKDIKSENSGNYYCQAHNSRGLRNSTLHSIVVPGSMTSVAAGSITALLLVIMFVIIFLFIRRKRSNKPGERKDNGGQLHAASVCENSSASAQRKPAEVQEELCYATVTFSKNQEDPLYSNIMQAPPKRPRQRPKQPKKEEEEDDEDVEYTMVNFKSASASTESRSPVVVDDPSALYSTVTKKPGV